MKDEINFDEKFSALGDYYKIDSPNDVRNFLKDNEGIFVLLDGVQCYLDEFFSDDDCCLEMVYDPECVECNHLVLRIYVSSQRFHNGVREDIWHIREQIAPIRREVGIYTEFAVRPGVKYV